MFKVIEHKKKELRWWFENRHTIDFSPSYQREGSLWKRGKKQKLIDSILNGYDIPKFYLADFGFGETKLDEKKKLYAVIDGKQRLQTFFDYLEDDFPLADDFILFDTPKIEIAGFKYSELKEKHSTIAAKILEFVPTVMSVVSDQELRVNDMFVRLNSGLTVNGAERRNAMPGIVPRLIRRMANKGFLSSKIKFATDRMQHYNVAAKILLIEHRGELVQSKQTQLDAFVKEGISGNQRPFMRAYYRSAHALGKLGKHFSDEDHALTRSGEIPIYYWLAKKNMNALPTLARFIHEFSNKLTETVRLSKKGETANPTLMRYYAMLRTSGDKDSKTGRFQILEDLFKKFKQNNTLVI